MKIQQKNTLLFTSNLVTNGAEKRLLVLLFLCTVCILASCSQISYSQEIQQTVRLVDLATEPQSLQLNYISPQDSNFIDKVQQGRIIEGNQDLASYSFCKKSRKEYINGKLSAEENSVSEGCLGLMVVNRLVSEQEKTRRGDNKRKAFIQGAAAIAGGIRYLTGTGL